MTTELTTDLVWQEVEKQLFAVLGMVTAKNEARTVGIVYTVHQRRLYITTKRTAWKTRHISQNPHISLTIPIAKRIPFMPWIKIPAATITCFGTAAIHEPSEIAPELLHKLFRGLETNADMMADTSIIAVEPMGDFVTYGVGVSLTTMRDTEKSRGRVPVS